MRERKRKLKDDNKGVINSDTVVVTDVPTSEFQNSTDDDIVDAKNVTDTDNNSKPKDKVKKKVKP